MDRFSDAYSKGIEDGDILMSVNDERITTPEALETLLYQYTPGDTVTLIIYRSGRQYQLSLTVDEAKG